MADVGALGQARHHHVPAKCALRSAEQQQGDQPRAIALGNRPLPGEPGEGQGRELGSVSLGRLTPRGEKSVLIVPEEVLMRLTWNPFFSYLAERVGRWVESAE